MTDTPRWAIVTSDHTRHRHFANVLSDHLLVHALVVEPKSRNPANNYDNTEDAAALANYFASRDASEVNILAKGQSWNLTRPLQTFEVSKGSINEPQVVQDLVAFGISHCLVFGASWLKTPWLEAFPGRLFNLHLGLSPHYRGVGTNFWPLHDGLPEYVGATIHLLDVGIDSGPILFHVRPQPAADDDAHSMGNKTIAKATRALHDRLEHLSAMPATPQWSEDKEHNFRSKDFNAQALAAMLHRLESGMMADYVQNLAERARRVRLVSEYEPIA